MVEAASDWRPAAALQAPSSMLRHGRRFASAFFSLERRPKAAHVPDVPSPQALLAGAE
jgi:hypothetical protein